MLRNLLLILVAPLLVLAPFVSLCQHAGEGHFEVLGFCHEGDAHGPEGAGPHPSNAFEPSPLQHHRLAREAAVSADFRDGPQALAAVVNVHGAAPAPALAPRPQETGGEPHPAPPKTLLNCTLLF